MHGDLTELSSPGLWQELWLCCPACTHTLRHLLGHGSLTIHEIRAASLGFG